MEQDTTINNIIKNILIKSACLHYFCFLVES